jgi:CheY-like chemotaxis protein
VLAAHDGSQALHLAGHNGFDVIVGDLRLVGADDCALLHRLRALPTCAAARYVVASADGDAGRLDDDGAAALAACTLLTKPYEIERLRRAVECE